MAIKYLDAKRIRGLSSDTKPTNVPENTLFEETDTFEIWFRQGSEWVTSAPSYAYIMGGRASNNNRSDTIFRCKMSTSSSSQTNVGNLREAQNGGGGSENDANTRIFVMGGYTANSANYGMVKWVDSFATGTSVTVSDWGDMVTNGSEGDETNSATHSYRNGGATENGASYSALIEKIQHSSAANGSSVGTFASGHGRQHNSACQDKSGGYGYHFAGYEGGHGHSDIERYSFSSDGNSSNVGDLVTSGTVGFNGGTQSADYGWQFGGRINNGSPTDDLQKFTFASSSTESKVGDLTNGFQNCQIAEDSDNAYLIGGARGSSGSASTATDEINTLAFATDTDYSSSVGDLTEAWFSGCCGTGGT